MKATKVNAGLAESNGRLLLGIWRDSLHVTCGLTACTPGSAPGPTLGNEYGKNFSFFTFLSSTHLQVTHDADSRKYVPFGGFVDIAPHFRGEIPQKPQFWGRESFMLSKLLHRFQPNFAQR